MSRQSLTGSSTASRPSRAFRIADKRYPIFDGGGAFRTGGRWNSPGKRVIYASENLEGAILELLVHMSLSVIPGNHVWIEVTIPHPLAVETANSDLIRGWAKRESAAARRFGDNWYDSGRSVALVVPSVTSGGVGRNILFNQTHPDFANLKASSPKPLIWDARLIRG